MFNKYYVTMTITRKQYVCFQYLAIYSATVLVSMKDAAALTSNLSVVLFNFPSLNRNKRHRCVSYYHLRRLGSLRPPPSQSEGFYPKCFPNNTLKSVALVRQMVSTKDSLRLLSVAVATGPTSIKMALAVMVMFGNKYYKVMTTLGILNF